MIAPAKHTPLPWAIHETGSGSFGLWGADGAHYVMFTNGAARSVHAVANGISAEEERRANVELVAEALALLSAHRAANGP